MILYAWVNPLSFTSSLNHAWVTSYDIRVHEYGTLQDVIDAGEQCWLCWGSFHPSGSTADQPDGFLLQADGDLTLSECLVMPNIPSQDNRAAQGTIFEYGIDGVCHQLANQTLFGANRAGVAPIVKDARGYWLSSYLYGDYGRTHHAWQEKQSGCAPDNAALAVDGGDMPDYLLAHAQRVLAEDSEAIAIIAEHREVHQMATLESLAAGNTTAEEINARNRASLIDLQQRIGRDKFHAVFNYHAEDAPDLVDPEMFAASRGQAPDPAEFEG